jgi:hypothetical protein
MNFFGHFVADGKEGDPWHNFGLVFPDLYRDLYRSSLAQRLGAIGLIDANMKAFAEGIAKHLERDSSFHTSTYFKEAELLIKASISKFPTLAALPRQWFFVHILIELITDRVLVATYPLLAKLMYDDFRKVMAQTTYYNVLFPVSEECLLFSTRLDRIQKDNYIFAYTNTFQLLQTIRHIYRKAGLVLSEQQVEAVQDEFATFVSILEKDERLIWLEKSATLT